MSEPLPPRATRRRRLGIGVIVGLYAIVAIADFVAPYSYTEQVRSEPLAPVSSVHFVDQNGGFHLLPLVYPIKLTDARLLAYDEVFAHENRVRLFVHGSEYRLLGVMPTNIHLFGLEQADGDSGPHLRLLGADQLGRDRFSRLMIGMRFSLLVAPAGAVVALGIGLVIGMIAGYISGSTDTVLMGITDTVIALPALILILAARAAFPLELSTIAAATMLVAIFGLTGWGEMARLVRGLVRSLRDQEFVLAARACGTTDRGILFRHIAPNLTRPVLIQFTLMLPAFLLAEVAMSFLGVGVQDPEPSLGNMLGSAADLVQIQQRPAGLIGPIVVIMLFLIAIRLIGSQRKGSL